MHSKVHLYFCYCHIQPCKGLLLPLNEELNCEFLLIYSFNSSAHMAHYNKLNKIDMEILRDGEVIGYNYYSFNIFFFN